MTIMSRCQADGKHEDTKTLLLYHAFNQTAGHPLMQRNASGQNGMKLGTTHVNEFRNEGDLVEQRC